MYMYVKYVILYTSSYIAVYMYIYIYTSKTSYGDCQKIQDQTYTFMITNQPVSSLRGMVVITS